MAFVKCSTYKAEQAEQDQEIEKLGQAIANQSNNISDGLSALETKVDNAVKANNTKDTKQDERLTALEKSQKSASDLAGVGIEVSDGKLAVKTVNLVNASGKVTLGKLVDKS